MVVLHFILHTSNLKLRFSTRSLFCHRTLVMISTKGSAKPPCSHCISIDSKRREIQSNSEITLSRDSSSKSSSRCALLPKVLLAVAKLAEDTVVKLAEDTDIRFLLAGFLDDELSSSSVRDVNSLSSTATLFDIEFTKYLVI